MRNDEEIWNDWNNGTELPTSVNQISLPPTTNNTNDRNENLKWWLFSYRQDGLLIFIKLLDNLNQVNTNTIISSCLHFEWVGFMFYITDYFHSI